MFNIYLRVRVIYIETDIRSKKRYKNTYKMYFIVMNGLKKLDNIINK